MSGEKKLRWSKFWWEDYAGDDDLRGVSLAAQGLWMRMLCLMHKGEPFGHLAKNNKPMSMKLLATLVSKKEREVTACVAELIEAGVCDITPENLIKSRRMCEDKKASDRSRENGALGGNPSLINDKDPDPEGTKVNIGVNPPPNPGITSWLNPRSKRLEAREEKEAAATLAEAPRSREDTARPIPETPLALPSLEPAADPLPPAFKPVPRDMRLMPKRSDNELRWAGLGDGHEVQGNPATAGSVRRTCRNKWNLTDIVELVCQAALIYDEHWRGDWWTLTDWLDAGIDPNAVIIPTIKRCMSRPKNTPIGRLAYFDKAVREAAGLPVERAA